MAQITLNSTGVASSGALVLQSNGTTTAVTINASQGVEFNAGTAAAPSITTTGDTNTGIFFPAADTIAFSEGGAEAMRIDSSGNVGIGTSSPAVKFQTQQTSAGNRVTGALLQNVGNTTNTAVSLDFAPHENTTAPEVLARINAVRTNPSNAPTDLIFSVNNITLQERARISSDGTFRVKGAGTAGSTDAFQVAGGAPADAARIDSNGTLLMGCTGGGASGNSIVSFGSGGDIQKIFSTQASSPTLSLFSMFSNAATSSAPTGTLRVNITTDGGISNFSANNVNLSDRREKTNFAPAKSYLETICAIPVQTFNYIDQNMEEDGGLTLGVVAQDVQAVAPELVTESNWGSKEEPKQRLSIYQTDLQYALMKCIQEQQALITALTARITALEAA